MNTSSAIVELEVRETAEEVAQLAINDDSDAALPQVNGIATSGSGSLSPKPPAPVRWQPNRKTGYIYDPVMLAHECTDVDGHPEQPARIEQIYNRLLADGTLLHMQRLPIRPVVREEVLLVHSEDQWEKVEAIQHFTDEMIEQTRKFYTELSLYVCRSTSHCALISCGGVIEATLAVARGEVRNSFAIVRPPGHHAEPDEHMGFCFYNNVAVAARVAQHATGKKRILVLDWDVHHGNGTQRAFEDDPSVLYISIHRHDGGRFYPCGPYGSLESCGEGPGRGFSVNIPWPDSGMNDADYIYAFQKVVMPIATEYAPDLVMISAGFDAAEGDELGGCYVTPVGYAHMTYMLCSLAKGQVVVALEGGYNLDAGANASAAVARVLLGDAPPEMAPSVASDIATETVWQVAKHLSQYWKSLDPCSCEPHPEIEPYKTSIPELLKGYRAQYLFSNHNMLEVPLADDTLRDKYASQIICSRNVMGDGPLVLFVHELGNIRAQMDGRQSCNVSMQHSHLLDVTKGVMSWAVDSGFNVIDINTFPRPASSTRLFVPDADQVEADVVRYIWDNYAAMSSAKQVVVIAHGNATQPVMQLIKTRVLKKKVVAIVQVIGEEHKIPTVGTTKDDLHLWYHQHSMVIVTKGHSALSEGKILKKHGSVMESEFETVSEILLHTLPDIKAFVQRQMVIGRPTAAIRPAQVFAA